MCNIPASHSVPWSLLEVHAAAFLDLHSEGKCTRKHHRCHTKRQVSYKGVQITRNTLNCACDVSDVGYLRVLLHLGNEFLQRKKGKTQISDTCWAQIELQAGGTSQARTANLFKIKNKGTNIKLKCVYRRSIYMKNQRNNQICYILRNVYSKLSQFKSMGPFLRFQKGSGQFKQ